MTRSPTSKSRIGWASAAVLVLLLLLALVVGLVAPGGDGLAPAPTPAVAERVRIESVEGTVERQGRGEDWEPVRAGQDLEADHLLRTGTDGAAVLGIADRARVQVSARTTLSVGDLRDRISRIELEDGRINAVVLGDSVLRVETPGSDVVAESGAGEFSAVADGRGRLVVAAREGKVKLTASSRTVEVASGEQAMAGPDDEPAPPQAIPTSLFLKLDPAALVARRDETTTVEGTTTAGSVVRARGRSVMADADGRFSLPVEVTEDLDEVEITVVDPLGRVTRSSFALRIPLKTGASWR